MTPVTFIEKAIEGGYKREKYMDGKFYDIHRVVLDPKAWKAVGITEKWGSYMCPNDECPVPTHELWEAKMMDMMQEIVKGGTIESYLITLIKL